MSEIAIQTIPSNPLALNTLEDMEKFAKYVAESGMFGITKPSQAMCLFMICKAEGRDPISALRRYHIIENRPSMRSDAMQADFIAAGGGIVWHVRTDELVGATFFADKKRIDPPALTNALSRFNALWQFQYCDDPTKRARLMSDIASLSDDGVETVIRTYADCEEKGITGGKNGTKNNWRTNPRAMLTARVITEGVRLINPGLIAGVYAPEELEDANLKGQQPGREEQSMQQILDMHMENANNATGAERQRHLGLAAEMRCRIADDQPEQPKAIRANQKPLEEAAGTEPAKDPQPESAAVEVVVEVEAAEKLHFSEYTLTKISKTYVGRVVGALTQEEVEALYASKSFTKAVASTDAAARKDAWAIEEAYKAWSATK